MSTKKIYFFGAKKAEGSVLEKNMDVLLGKKGANLARMTELDLPVPPGCTISTEICHYFQKHGTFPESLEKELQENIQKIEAEMQPYRFGDKEKPLLVSVRSGASVSMPGMMDTVLNLGLNDESVLGLAKQSRDERFAYDSYRRFIMMYGSVVMGVSSSIYHSEFEKVRRALSAEKESIEPESLKKIIDRFKSLTKEHAGKEFPQDPQEQLLKAVAAVFNSWMGNRAKIYRQINSISASHGTAVSIQAMVYGNMGNDCATGVAFTRNPSTGENKFFGEFLIDAQGEDVVAGIRTPNPINEESKTEINRELSTLKELMPKVFGELEKFYKNLEKHYKDMQDIEFTIQNKKLYLLQTRNGKRTAQAAIRIAMDLVAEGLITKEEAILRVNPEDLNQLLHPSLDKSSMKSMIAKGLPASPGAAVGKIVFDPDTAQEWVKERGEKVILVREETSPEDIHGMTVAEGILTASGGMTSHAAVVARSMGKTCVVGCSGLEISYKKKEMIIDGKIFLEGSFITVDGKSGNIMEGEMTTINPGLTDEFREFMKWSDEFRRLKVRSNADSPKDARVSREFGAEGIGLCRTEHMFFELNRIREVRRMILANSTKEREAILKKILPIQRKDFIGIFHEMDGLPITIRLLDPPLHEFFPQKQEEREKLAAELDMDFSFLEKRLNELHEFNPMLGHRGCRLGISFPEIYRMQVRAILEAACILRKENKEIEPEIMVPLVAHWKELEFVRNYCEEEIQKVFQEQEIELPYSIGTMIEVPRAALSADEIADPKKGKAQFFSFGTNDLTQTSYALSRDDSNEFLSNYLEKNILSQDPFVSIDEKGVGRLMKIAIDMARAQDPKFKIGICGEHGGDPKSIFLCEELGLSYISCSPYRIPIARLSAAQAVLKVRRENISEKNINH